MPDIDALDRENPLAVTEYVNDIFNYWFRVEVSHPLNLSPEPNEEPVPRLFRYSPRNFRSAVA